MRLTRFAAAALLVAIAIFPCRAQPVGPTALSPGQYLTARFEHERFIAGFDTPLLATGDLVLSADGDLIWRTAAPVASELVITRTVMAQFVDGQVTMRVPLAGHDPQEEINGLLVRILTGGWHALGVAARPDGEGWRVEARGADLPASLSTQVSSISASGAQFATEVTLVRPTGDKEHFRFLDQAFHEAPMADSDRALLSRAQAE